MRPGRLLAAFGMSVLLLAGGCGDSSPDASKTLATGEATTTGKKVKPRKTRKKKEEKKGKAPIPAPGTSRGDQPTANPGNKEAPLNAAEKPTATAPGTPTEGTPPTVVPDEGTATDVATVNGKPIRADVFEAEVAKITSRNAKIPEERLQRIRSNILQRLIERELVKQAVENAGITVGASELQVSYDEYRTRFQSDEQFENYLKHGQATVEAIKVRLGTKLRLEKLIETRGGLQVDNNEVAAFYKKNKNFYTEKAGVKASHILVKLAKGAGKDQKKAAMDKIKAAQARLKAGESFDVVAMEMSEGPSKSKGGDLGFFGKGQMVKDFEKKAFSMKAGEVSGPVRTRFGYHLIKVIATRAERTKSLDEVREQIRKSLKNKKFFQERRKLLAELQGKATITSTISKAPAAVAPPQ